MSDEDYDVMPSLLHQRRYDVIVLIRPSACELYAALTIVTIATITEKLDG